MLGLGTTEIIILVIILMLLFGANKLPEIAKSIGQGIRHILGIFKEESTDNQNSDQKNSKSQS